MNFANFQTRCHQQAVEKGFSAAPPIPEQIALIHSEVSEALESYRNNEPLTWTDEHGKPQGLASEYADVVIRIGHYMASLGLSMEDEITRKLDYNATRTYKHGGKII